MTARSRFLVLVLVLAPASALAQPATEAPVVNPWSVGTGLRIGGLETYPAVGVSVDALRRVGRWRLGPELSIYAPRAFGDVRRSAIGAWLSTEFLIIESRRRVNLTWDMGLGLAVLRDDYHPRSYFADLTRVAPGLAVGMGLEVVATERVLIVVDVRGVYYWGGQVVDHEWLELGLGVRVRL